MAANRIESPRAEGGAAASAAPAAAGAAAGAAAAPVAAQSGLMAWMPVIANLVLMPVLAYVTIVYLIAPKLNHAEPAEAAEEGGQEHAKAPAKESGKPSEHGAAKSGKGGEATKGSKGKVSVPLNKSILVNVMGSMGTRYLLGNFTIVGTGADFEGRVKENDAQLRDAAAGIMGSKTLQDLEKPGARNLVRTELITVFNTILGGKVQDIFMTEFAVQ